MAKKPKAYTDLRVMAAKAFFWTRLANKALMTGKHRIASDLLRKVAMLHQQAHAMETLHGNNYVNEHYWEPVHIGLENINAGKLLKLEILQEAS